MEISVLPDTLARFSELYALVIVALAVGFMAFDSRAKRTPHVEDAFRRESARRRSTLGRPEASPRSAPLHP